MIIIFIPFGLLLVFALCAIAIGYQIWINILNTLAYIGITLLCFAILFCLHLLFQALAGITENFLYILNEIFLFLFLVFGFFPFTNLSFLDKYGRFFNWFGVDSYLSFVIPFASVFIIFIVLVIISVFVPFQSVLLLLIDMFPIIVFLWSAQICTNSWSDFFVSQVPDTTSIAEYTITETTSTYYPALRDDQRFPALFPLKYKGKSFQADEIVYLLSDWDEDTWGKNYIAVGNGERAAIIERNKLQKNEESYYSYSWCVSSDSAYIYNCNEESKVSIVDGHTFIHRSPGDSIIGTLEKGTRLEVVDLGYDMVQIMYNGVYAYIDRLDIHIVRN